MATTINFEFQKLSLTKYHVHINKTTVFVVVIEQIFQYIKINDCYLYYFVVLPAMNTSSMNNTSFSATLPTLVSNE